MAEEKLDLGEEKKGFPKKNLFIILGVLLLIGILAGLYFSGIFSKSEKAEEPKTAESNAGDKKADKKNGKHDEKNAGHAVYFAITPSFTVNFKNNAEFRLLQIDIAVSASNQAVIDAIKKHMPLLRNNLLMLLSAEDPTVLKTAEGKTALREKIKATIEEMDQVEAVDEVYFTGFIMQ